MLAHARTDSSDGGVCESSGERQVEWQKSGESDTRSGVAIREDLVTREEGKGMTVEGGTRDRVWSLRSSARDRVRGSAAAVLRLSSVCFPCFTLR